MLVYVTGSSKCLLVCAVQQVSEWTGFRCAWGQMDSRVNSNDSACILQRDWTSVTKVLFQEIQSSKYQRKGRTFLFHKSVRREEANSEQGRKQGVKGEQ